MWSKNTFRKVERKIHLSLLLNNEEVMALVSWRPRDTRVRGHWGAVVTRRTAARPPAGGEEHAVSCPLLGGVPCWKLTSYLLRVSNSHFLQSEEFVTQRL